MDLVGVILVVVHFDMAHLSTGNKERVRDQAVVLFHIPVGKQVCMTKIRLGKVHGEIFVRILKKNWK